MKIFIGSKFSCGLNYQHDYLKYHLMNNFEITEYVDEGDILVFASSCTCTKDTLETFISYVKRCLALKKPGAKTYLTGCLTREFRGNDFYFKELKKWLESNIDYIIPHNNPDSLLQTLSSETFSDFESNVFGKAIGCGNNEANIYIANGCLNNCAFCKLVYQKYPLNSVEPEEVKHLIDLALEAGINNINFIATNITQYGIDIYSEPRLMDIVDYVESIDAIKKYSLIGFSYKDAIRYGFAVPLSESPKLDYISGSLETGSPRLLEMIHKGFTVEEIIAYVKEMNFKYHRRLDLNIISGLPTETEDDVTATLRALDELYPYRVGINEYVSSPFLKHLNSFPQLSDDEIRKHTQIYESELKRKRVKTSIMFKKNI